MEAIRKSAMNTGLILGLVLVVLTTIIYAIDINLFTKPWVGIINFVVILGFGVYAAIKSKKINGGFLSFKEAFTSFFIALVLGFFISTLYTILLFNVIDPEAKTIINDNVIKYTVDMMQKFGTKASDINAMVAEMEKSDSFGFAGQMKGFAFNVVIYSIIGLITALIVKKKDPKVFN